MKKAFNFLKKIMELVIIFASVFIIPAVVHSIATLDYTHYLEDLSSATYCAIMSFVSFMSIVFYIDVHKSK
jgi:hypothetical protein